MEIKRREFIAAAMIVGFEQTWQIDDFKARLKRALARKAGLRRG